MQTWPISEERSSPPLGSVGARSGQRQARTSPLNEIKYATMMTNSQEHWMRNRRAFLKFLAGSPYLAALGGLSAAAVETEQASDVITDPKDALDVMDFEAAARRKVSPGHWACMASGVDDDST